MMYFRSSPGAQTWSNRRRSRLKRLSEWGQINDVAFVSIVILILAALSPPSAIPTVRAAGQLTKDPDQTHGRFGDPTTVAPNLQGYLYGVVKGKSADSITLDKTKFGVDKEIKLDKKTKFEAEFTVPSPPQASTREQPACAAWWASAVAELGPEVAAHSTARPEVRSSRTAD